MAPLADLPAEIRNFVYAELFKDENTYQDHSCNEHALFTASKKFHTEASSYFYRHNHLTIDVPTPMANTANILPPIANKYLRFIKHLTLRAQTGEAHLPTICRAASTISSLATIGATFTELKICIVSPLSQLLNSRVDDAIMGYDHPFTQAIRHLLASQVAKSLCLDLTNAWFADGVVKRLQIDSCSHISFSRNGIPTTDLSVLERPRTGRFSSTHIMDLGLNPNDLSCCNSGNTTPITSSPSSLPSSLCSAFADLDTYSVSSFETASSEDAAEPFFKETDIEEWAACTSDTEDSDVEILGEMDDLACDDDMEDVCADDVELIMRNMQDVAHHVANDKDVSYMTNFAPELLLSRHHLSHLM